MFWEAVNAIGVLGAPAVISIWDDGYGISVPNEHQITKGDLSALFSGFRRAPGSRQGYDVYAVKGWDYAGLCETYLSAVPVVRAEHVPALVHVTEMTQPQGHSTSGSHERYKSKERLAWETEFDPIRKMREWMIAQGIATAQELEAVEAEDLRTVREAQRRAWDDARAPIDEERRTALAMLDELAGQAANPAEIRKLRQELERQPAPQRREILAALHGALIATAGEDPPAARRIVAWKREQERVNAERYGSDLYSATERSALKIAPVPAVYAPDAPVVNGFEVVNAAFDAALARDAQPDRLRRGRRPDRRRQPGLRRPAGQVRAAAGGRHRHPRVHDHGAGDRPGAAGPAADRGDPVSRLRPLRRCRSSRTTSPPCAGAPRGGRRRR